MTCYLVQPGDRIFVKNYGSLSFAKNMGRNIDKNISKNLSSNKYSQNRIDKQSATDSLKTTSKKAIRKRAKATGDLIRNKIADKITRVSKNLTENNS